MLLLTKGRLPRLGLGLSFAQMVWLLNLRLLQSYHYLMLDDERLPPCKGRISAATKELDAAFTQVNELTSNVGDPVGEENADDVPF